MHLNKLFEKNNICINLYTNKEAWKKFLDFHKLFFFNINLINCNLPTYKIKKKETLDFFKSMSKKIDSNVIISDNYEEICFFKKNVILIANFYWNTSSKDKDYLNILDFNVIKNNCILFGNNYFSAEYIKNNSNYVGVGFFGKKKKIVNILNNKNKILFVKGFGSYKNNFERRFRSLYHSLDKKYDIIFDQNISFAKKLNLKTVKKFDEKLFYDLKVIIGRPSFGILTDAIARNIPFLPISDPNDIESIETEYQINNIFGKSNNIERYVNKSVKLYKNHLFLFKAENEMVKIILGKLDET